MKWLIVGIVGIVGIVVTVAIIVNVNGGSDAGERADFGGQGCEGPLLAESGASLIRSGDGIRVSANTPIPMPGTYEYPSADMVPDGSPAHPEVLPGGPDEPEVFTMWAFVYNYPDTCTDDTCDVDDSAQDAMAAGGVFQADGRVADGERLEFDGSVRLGQEPGTGSALVNPLGAEVHLAIAAHNKMLDGSDGWRQLNGPLGNPTLWWAASFEP
jgi:hypothetical protein